ncbi:ATP-binding protein [Paenibacillus sp. strain BS8-2]
MKLLIKCVVGLLALSMIIGTIAAISPGRAEAAASGDASFITEWQMLWEQPDQPLSIEEVRSLKDDEGWFDVHSDEEYPRLPEGINSAWIKFKLPELSQMRPAIYMDKVFARDAWIYIDGQLVFEMLKDYKFIRNKIIIPLSTIESNKMVYMKLTTSGNQNGIKYAMKIGEYDNLSRIKADDELYDVVLGASLIFLSLFSFITIMFINRFVLSEWYAFFLVMFSIGVMILSYSTFFHSTYKQFGEIVYYSFDFATILLLPSIFYFFEKVFGSGPFKIIKHFKTTHIFLSGIYIASLIIGFIFPSYKIIYETYGSILLGLSIIVSLIVLVVVLIIYCRSKSKEAIIITIGFSTFALLGVSELILYFANSKLYQLKLWKVGVFIFLASLMIVLVRRAIQNYKQVISYSKQLEVFNVELQRSEKMEMVSQLAASVAHEVRNPLQVTRGFLQLLRERTLLEKDKDYMMLAIEELDRASEIITDFLTFAKPGSEMYTVINIRDELQQIEAILIPLATMQGGSLKVTGSFEALVKGNSSKFKQAVLNIVKNSLEAIESNGIIRISINELKETNEVHICIEDNGVGMDKHVVSQLGEPFYSQKSKGTGLGLMVTFRIVEAMNGKINYESEKNKGTRVNMIFPLV